MKATNFPGDRPAWRWGLLMCGLAVLLGGCSSGTPASKAPPPIAVSTAMPVRRTFHDKVSAFGQLAANARQALSLSLPQAGQVVATDVIAGTHVDRGAPLLRFAIAPAGRSAYLQAQAGVQVARGDLKRTEELHAEKLATNGQVDAARKALADAEAALAAQARLGGAHAATTLRAPAEGVVTAINVHPGQRVTAGMTLVQFSPQSALAAQLGVSPGAAAGIRTGVPVVIHPVYAAAGAKPLHGTVAMVGAAVNPLSHLVDVVASIDGNPGLATGSALSATIETRPFQAWAVPRDALQIDAKGDYIYQIVDGKAARVDVKVVAPDGSPIGVEGAIDPHAPVITLGSYEISDGQPVKAQKARAAKAPTP